MTALFRTEVLAAQSSQWLGEIRIARNVRFDVVAIGAGCIVVAMVLLSALGSVSRKAKAVGILVPMSGTLQLSTISAGTLLSAKVSEGQHVQAGQDLFVVNTDRANGAGATSPLIARRLDERRQALALERLNKKKGADQRRRALRDRTSDLAKERERAVQEAAFLHSRVELAIQRLTTHRDLARAGFVPELQIQQRQDELLDVQARLESVRRLADSHFRSIREIEAEIDTIEYTLGAELAQIDRLEAQLEQEGIENQTRGSNVVVAPRPGTITAIHVPIGEALQAGQAVATMVPDVNGQATTLLDAQLYAPSRVVGFAQVGQQVRLRYAAFPYQKFGMADGEVSAISYTPVSPQDLPSGQGNALLGAAQTTEPLFRINVKLRSQSVRGQGKYYPLKPGMTLDADLIQEDRQIWEWALEPLLAVRQKVWYTTPGPQS